VAETQEGKIRLPGDLIPTQADGFENVKVTVEEVPVGDLALDNALPDYKKETSFPMPIAVKGIRMGFLSDVIYVPLCWLSDGDEEIDEEAMFEDDVDDDDAYDY
jgi:hypothetical protein